MIIPITEHYSVFSLRKHLLRGPIARSLTGRFWAT